MTDLMPCAPRPTTLTRIAWVLVIAFGVGTLYSVLINHAAHVYTVLPFLLFGACPLIRLLHGHRHGHHKPADPSSGSLSSTETSKEHHDHKS